MTTNLWGGVGLGLVLALGAPLGPRGPIGSEAAAQDAGAKAERLTLDVKDQPLADVIPYIRKLTGRTIVLGSGPHGVALRDLKPVPVVTVQFEDVPWKQALRIVAESADCLVRSEGTKFVVYRPTRVTLEFERADLRDVVSAIARQSGANIIIGTDVPDGLEVSVRLRNVPWQHALSAVVKSVGMTALPVKGSSLTRIGSRAAIAREQRDEVTPDEAARRVELSRRAKQAEAQIKLLEAEIAVLRKKLTEMSAQLRERK